MKVIFCTPSLSGPIKPQIESLEASIPLIREAGWDEGYLHYLGCQYISHARAELGRRALEANADVVVFLDYDLSWRPRDLLTLIETEGDVVAGNYRFREPTERYMGVLFTDENHKPIVRDDGCLKAVRTPAGFLKVTRKAFAKIEAAHPELVYHDPEHPERRTLDLFHHGTHNGVWWGEDMAFSRRWRDMGEELWMVPDLNLTHWHRELKDGKEILIPHPGNLHEYLLRCPGGRLHGETYGQELSQSQVPLPAKGCCC